MQTFLDNTSSGPAHENGRARIDDTGGVRLNIGAGGTAIAGFIPVDRKGGQEAYPLAYPDNSVDEIYASHVFEHFSHRQRLDVLRDWARALKPGGRIRIAVPDFDWIAAHRDEPRTELFLMGGHADSDDHHGSMFTEVSLTACLKRVGFVNVARFEPFVQDCSSLPVSLNLEAIKRPTFAIKQNPVICAVLSTNRLGFTDMYACLFTSMSGMGITLIQSSGAFWEQHVTGAIETAITRYTADYVISLDYDSVFTEKDVRRMIEVMQSDPSISAAFPVQMNRHRPVPICDTACPDYEAPVAPATHGHFGLSIFRGDVFRELQQPWFWGMPAAEDGRWLNENKRDADVVLWDALFSAGHKVVRVNDVTIGHGELAVIWPCGDKPKYQLISDYRKNGKPADARWTGRPPEGASA